MRRWTRGLIAAFLVLGPALGASAHAVLVETDPADGARHEEPPNRVTLRFSEPVDLPDGALRIFDASGRRIDTGEVRSVGSGESLEAGLTGLADGSYVVAWRVVSLDGHPIRGAFVFGVGEGEAAVDEGLIEDLLGPGRSPAARIAGSAVRWVTYLSGLVAAGVGIFAGFVLGRSRSVPRLASVMRRAAVSCAVASALAIPAFVAEAQATWGEAVTSSVGVAASIRMAAMVVLAMASRRPTPLPVIAGVAVLAAAELVTGHTRTSEPRLLVMAADAVHVLGAAFWIGGLVALLLTWRHMAGDAPGAAEVVGRFSTLAVRFVLGLAAAGLVLAWIEVGEWAALVSTAYGWTLVAKSAVAAAVLGVAAYNKRVLVSRIVSDEQEERRPAWERLRATVRAEVVGLALVVGLTAVLVDLPPAAEGLDGPYSTYVDLGEGELNLVVDPGRVGTNQVHAYVLTAAGTPADVEGEARFEFHYPAQDVGPIVRRAVFVGPGHWIHTGPELAVAGEWHVTFRLGDGFEAAMATAVVRVTG
ncbi:MAG TPA: copper resistance protein CopC [Acidimicrobiia bacterium]|nr:copper resistance protein CopC [Acidimicrobiia bacterium]